MNKLKFDSEVSSLSNLTQHDIEMAVEVLNDEAKKLEVIISEVNRVFHFWPGF